MFLNTLSGAEKDAFDDLVKCVKNVLFGINDTSFNAEILQSMTKNFENMGANFSPKMHYVLSHINIIQSESVVVSDQHGEKFHQVLKFFEERYNRKHLVNMLSDYMWSVACPSS